ncbi:MAG TPA: tetratricopeptide repeat protein [Longimicrobium sp.]|uniref:tetratricopeptide repeat protein n=1 Tax=Longimicrobium sp. TaxID=2029185 RepID=UPI002ED8E800
MTQRPLKIDAALKAIPETDDLAHLRQALLSVSRADGGLAWGSAGEYGTIDMRLADPAALEGQIEALADRVRRRVEMVMRHTVRALAALERGDVAEAARHLVAAGEVEEGERRLLAAQHFYERALEFGRKPRDRRGEGLALRRLGRVARAMGQWELSARRYEEGYEVSVAQRDDMGAVVACQGLGNVHVDQSRWSEARAWYLRGVERCPARPSTVEYVHLCVGLSVVERRLGDLGAAAEWLARGEESAAGLGDAVMGFVDHAWGRLHLARGQAAEAEAAFGRALARELDPVVRVAVMVGLSEPLLRQGRAGEAFTVARDAEALAIHSRAVLKLPDVYRALGAAAAERGDTEAFLFYEQALEVCRDHELPAFEVAATQHQYGRVEARRGDSEAAAARLREAHRLYAELGARMEAEEVAEELGRMGAVADDDEQGRTA